MVLLFVAISPAGRGGASVLLAARAWIGYLCATPFDAGLIRCREEMLDHAMQGRNFNRAGARLTGAGTRNNLD